MEKYHTTDLVGRFERYLDGPRERYLRNSLYASAAILGLLFLGGGVVGFVLLSVFGLAQIGEAVTRLFGWW